MVGGISLAGANTTRAEIRMNTLAVELSRIRVGPRRQLVTHRADVLAIQQDAVRKLSLEPKRPTLGVRSAKVLVENPGLVIERGGRWSTNRHLGRPVRP